MFKSEVNDQDKRQCPLQREANQVRVIDKQDRFHRLNHNLRPFAADHVLYEMEFNYSIFYMQITKDFQQRNCLLD